MAKRDDMHFLARFPMFCAPLNVFIISFFTRVRDEFISDLVSKWGVCFGVRERSSSGKNKSEIWKYLTLTGDAKKTICTLCQTNLAYSSGTASMLKHMKYVHKSININNDETSQEGIKRQRSMMDYHRSKLVLTDPSPK